MSKRLPKTPPKEDEMIEIEGEEYTLGTVRLVWYVVMLADSAVRALFPMAIVMLIMYAFGQTVNPDTALMLWSPAFLAYMIDASDVTLERIDEDEEDDDE
jgi:hypothetical protein